METKAKIDSALKDAMRQNDDVAKRTLRMAKAAIKLAEVEKGTPLDESGVIAIIQKEIKSRNESIIDAQKANREDLVASYEEEAKLLKTFLPEPMAPAELTAMAQQAITEIGASSMADMGKVIKTLMPKVQGRATGEQVSQTVRQLLQKS